MRRIQKIRHEIWLSKRKKFNKLIILCKKNNS